MQLCKTKIEENINTLKFKYYENIKKLVLGLGILGAGMVSAQNSEMTNMIKLGVNGGIAVPSSNASANVGSRFVLPKFSNPRFWSRYRKLVIISFWKRK